MFMHLRHESNSAFLYDKYSNTISDRCSFAVWEISICAEYNDNYYNNDDRIKNLILYISSRDRGNWRRNFKGIPHNLEQKLDSYCYNIMLDSCVRLVLLDSLEVWQKVGYIFVMQDGKEDEDV